VLIHDVSGVEADRSQNGRKRPGRGAGDANDVQIVVG